MLKWVIIIIASSQTLALTLIGTASIILTPHCLLLLLYHVLLERVLIISRLSCKLHSWVWTFILFPYSTFSIYNSFVYLVEVYYVTTGYHICLSPQTSLLRLDFITNSKCLRLSYRWSVVIRTPLEKWIVLFYVILLGFIYSLFYGWIVVSILVGVSVNSFTWLLRDLMERTSIKVEVRFRELVSLKIWIHMVELAVIFICDFSLWLFFL